MCGHGNQQVADAGRRAQLRDALRSSFEATIEARVERYLEIAHQTIIANHYFAAASAQCIELYWDGRFLSAVMVSQAVNEGIWKLVAERKGIGGKGEHSDRIESLAKSSAISQQCAEASDRIWRSFRNDVHHMNPKVAQIDFRALARSNLQDLAVVEKEIFGCNVKDGKLVPHHPEYWDIQEDGTVPAFLRLSS